MTEKEFTMEDVIKASQDNRVWNWSNLQTKTCSLIRVELDGAGFGYDCRMHTTLSQQYYCKQVASLI